MPVTNLTARTGWHPAASRGLVGIVKKTTNQMRKQPSTNILHSSLNNYFSFLLKTRKRTSKQRSLSDPGQGIPRAWS